MDKEITIDSIVKDLKDGVADNPSLLSDYLIRLSASIYTGGVIELDLQVVYACKWQELRLEAKSDKACDMAVMATDEFRDWRKAQITNKTILECVRAIKKKLRTLELEYHEGQNYG